MVTYSTMSCRGLPVSGARLTDRSAGLQADSENSLGKGDRDGGQGGGPAWAVYTRQLSSFLAHSSSLSAVLSVCVLSYFLQLLIVRTARL